MSVRPRETPESAGVLSRQRRGGRNIAAWLLAGVVAAWPMVAAADEPPAPGGETTPPSSGDAAQAGDPAQKDRAAPDIDPEAEAADPSSAATESGTADDPPAEPQWSLPESAPGGRPFRLIALYGSQLAELIPEHYRPVALQQLSDAISQSSLRDSDPRRCRTEAAYYEAELRGDTLVSERSVLRLESDAERAVRHSLGPVNFALAPAGPAGSGAELPRLETAADGSLVAVVEGDSDVEFEWTLRGRSSGLANEFDLQLPRCPESLIELTTPAEIVVETLDGVLREVPPLPKPGETAETDPVRRYLIDAGGLSTVRLRTRSEDEQGPERSLLVRRCSLQYDIESSGMSWTARMVVQVPAGGELPPLALHGGTATSVEIDGVEVPFTTAASADNDAAGGAERRLQLERPGSESGASGAPMSVTISGRATWQGEQGWCPLPWPVWDCQQVVQGAATSEAQLRVSEPLSVLMWQLPSGWTQEVASRLSDTATVLQAQGPPLVSDVSQAAGGEAASWSRVRLARRSSLQASDSTLRLNVQTETLQAVARIELTVDPDRIEPVPVQVQSGWTLGSLRLPTSGRVIEAPSTNPATGTVTLWPVAEDLDDSVLVIEARGRAPLPPGEKVTVPSTWFARIAGVPGDYLTAVVPPPELNWSGETALQGQPVERSELSDDQQLFLRTISDNSLIFRPRTGRTPRLQLQQPSVALSVSTTLHFIRDGEYITERLVIQADASGQIPPQLTVVSGPSAGRPRYRWSLRDNGNSAPISLPSTDVQLDDREGEGTYTIDLSDRDWRGRELVAQRRYRLVEPLETRLPSIPRAASQDAEAFLQSGLVVRESSPAVLRVPVEEDPTSPAIRLRYDAVDQPALRIEPSQRDPAVAVVWHEDIQLVASSRGTDRIEARYRITSPQPIRIDYPRDLQLAAIYRNGERLEPPSTARPPIELSGGSGTETVRIVWNRLPVQPGAIRRCTIPPLEISGAVLKSQRRLVAAPDTFVPATLWRGLGTTLASTGGGPIPVTIETGSRVWLVQRNLALGAGWLVALAIFALSWWLARRQPAASVIATLAFAAAALLWAPWATAIVGWMVLPCAAGALLAVSLHSRRERFESGITAETERASGSAWRDGSALTAAPGSSRMGRALPGVLLAAALALTSGPAGLAQEDRSDVEADSGGSDPIDVLVPVDADGGQLGDKVYIPETVYRQLFQAPQPDLPQEVHFSEANYQITLSRPREGDREEPPVAVEAEYVLRAERTATRLRLPIPAASIRRVELVQADADRIVRFSDGPQGGTIVTVPPEDEFRVRLTLVPELEVGDGVHRLGLDVPPVTSAQLTVEADRGVDGIDIMRSAGQVRGDPELRRWVAQVGPVDRLSLRYRLETPLDQAESQPLRRRYWIHAGKTRTAVDCEVSPPESLSVGESIELVVLDSELPTVVSPAWRLQRSELLSPSRWLVSFVKRADTDAPISLLWSLETVVGQQQGESASGAEPPDEAAQSMAIPDVVAAGPVRATPAWVAIHADPDLRIDLASGQPTEPLAVDQFLAAWSGYRGRIDRALVALGQLPSVSIARRPRAEAHATQQHHLHATPEELQLRFVAQLDRGDRTTARRTLRLPRWVELLDLTVNGRTVGARPHRVEGFQEVPLGRLPDRDVVTIEAMAVAPVDGRRRFSLPQMHLWPAVATSDTYTLSRDHATRVRTIRPPEIPPDRDDYLGTAEALTEGWIPVATWSSQRSAEAPAGEGIGGRFQMLPRPTRFDSRQLIALFWQQGRWSMETSIELLSEPVPDYIDVELPTAWCQSLEIEPATVWSRQPATDPSRQVVRIQCGDETRDGKTISIRGQLESSDKGRLSVPPVTVLGSGRRRVLISVPDRLTNEPVQWRTSAVAAIEQLPRWAARIAPAKNRSTYSAAGAAWSIELATLPQVSAEASAGIADFQVFPQYGHSLVLARWDLVPAGLDSVAVRIPPEATSLGAWTAGRPVHATPLAPPGTDPNSPENTGSVTSSPAATETILRIPLSVSRLSQSVELLLRVPATAPAASTDALPELLDIAVGGRWVAHYVSAPVTGSDESPPPPALPPETRRRAAQRYRTLAQSVVTSVEQSLDLLAERPTSEVAAWLTSWAARYQELAQAAGRTVDWSAQPEPEDSDPPERAGEDRPESGVAGDLTSSTTSPPATWRELDRRMALQVERFLDSETEFPSTLFNHARLHGYQLSDVAMLDPDGSAPPLPSLSSESEGLRFLIGRLLTLLMVLGAMAILWPLRQRGRRLLQHPSFWLAAVALCGFLVAPLPVAIALLVVALSMPLLTAPQRSR